MTELARLWKAYATASPLELIALKAAAVMCVLLLQKPHVKSKAHDHKLCLERRLGLWSKGPVSEQLHEGRTIQGRLYQGKNQSPERIPSAFTNLMIQGRVSAAMRLISETTNGGLLDLEIPVTDSKTVRDVLKEKHPEAMDVEHDILLAETDGPKTPHPVLFDCLTGSSIKTAALRTFGGAGPSGIDASG